MLYHLHLCALDSATVATVTCIFRLFSGSVSSHILSPSHTANRVENHPRLSGHDLKATTTWGELGRRMNGQKEPSLSTAFLHMAIHVICLLSLSPQSLSDACAPGNFGSGTEAAQNGLFPSLRFWGQRCAHRKQICSAFLCRKL